MTKFNRFMIDNKIISVSPIDDDVEFTSCDASGVYSDCLRCDCLDADGNEFTLDLSRYELAEWINAE